MFLRLNRLNSSNWWTTSSRPRKRRCSTCLGLSLRAFTRVWTAHVSPTTRSGAASRTTSRCSKIQKHLHMQQATAIATTFDPKLYEVTEVFDGQRISKHSDG